MSNYNERLDEVLANLGERYIMVEHRLVHLGMPEQNGKNTETRKAKQAITSLIKELVEEAKPYYCDGSKQCRCTTDKERNMNVGKEIATRKFEQNLLKALEEG